MIKILSKLDNIDKVPSNYKMVYLDTWKPDNEIHTNNYTELLRLQDVCGDNKQLFLEEVDLLLGSDNIFTWLECDICRANSYSLVNMNDKVKICLVCLDEASELMYESMKHD